jgi:hypothetical protein
VLTYLTLDGDILDLTSLTGAERAFFERILALWRERAPYDAVRELVSGPENPILEPGCRVTAAVHRHPLWRAVYDLESRLGILQGEIGPAPGDEAERDPVADEWMPSAQAAAAKGVTLAGLHKAIERGDLVAAPAKPGGLRVVVSRNSLDRWTPNPVRQAARRRSGAA